jgi:hypothetical protein
METGPGKIFETEKWNPDVGVIPNIVKIIKYEGSGQGIRINQDDYYCHHEKQQCFMSGWVPD